MEKGMSPGPPIHTSNPTQGLLASTPPQSMGDQGTPEADRVPSLYQTSHTPLPRLSKQAGSKVLFSAGAARRELPRLS